MNPAPTTTEHALSCCYQCYNWLVPFFPSVCSLKWLAGRASLICCAGLTKQSLHICIENGGKRALAPFKQQNTAVCLETELNTLSVQVQFGYRCWFAVMHVTHRFSCMRHHFVFLFVELLLTTQYYNFKPPVLGWFYTYTLAELTFK